MVSISGVVTDARTLAGVADQAPSFIAQVAGSTLSLPSGIDVTRLNDFVTRLVQPLGQQLSAAGARFMEMLGTASQAAPGVANAAPLVVGAGGLVAILGELGRQINELEFLQGARAHSGEADVTLSRAGLPDVALLYMRSKERDLYNQVRVHVGGLIHLRETGKLNAGDYAQAVSGVVTALKGALPSVSDMMATLQGDLAARQARAASAQGTVAPPVAPASSPAVPLSTAPATPVLSVQETVAQRNEMLEQTLVNAPPHLKPYLAQEISARLDAAVPWTGDGAAWLTGAAKWLRNLPSSSTTLRDLSQAAEQEFRTTVEVLYPGEPETMIPYLAQAVADWMAREHPEAPFEQAGYILHRDLPESSSLLAALRNAALDAAGGVSPRIADSRPDTGGMNPEAGLTLPPEEPVHIPGITTTVHENGSVSPDPRTPAGGLFQQPEALPPPPELIHEPTEDLSIQIMQASGSSPDADELIQSIEAQISDIQRTVRNLRSDARGVRASSGTLDFSLQDRMMDPTLSQSFGLLTDSFMYSELLADSVYNIAEELGKLNESLGSNPGFEIDRRQKQRLNNSLNSIGKLNVSDVIKAETAAAQSVVQSVPDNELNALADMVKNHARSRIYPFEVSQKVDRALSARGNLRDQIANAINSIIEWRANNIRTALNDIQRNRPR